MKHQRVGLSESSQNAPKSPLPLPVYLHSDSSRNYSNTRAGSRDTGLKDINENDNESERDDSGAEMEAEMEEYGGSSEDKGEDDEDHLILSNMVPNHARRLHAFSGLQLRAKAFTAHSRCFRSWTSLMLSDPGEDTINVPLRILVKPSAYPHHPDSDRTAVTMAVFWRVVDLWHQEKF